MSIFVDVVKELLGMFWADARLTIAVLLLVALTAGLMIGLRASPLLGGTLLVAGSLLILVEAAVRGARRPK